ncbi:MAG: VOC family protein [Acidobacteria bacterium]|nr:VOC family protein [Acidobacteriota bacterium]
MELTHVRVLVRDFPGCFRFYRDTLGLKTGFPGDGGPYAEFAIGGDKFLALFDRTLMAGAVGTSALPANSPAQDRVALVLSVADVDAEAERLRRAGAPITAPPADRPDWGLRTVHLRDPDGNLIELYCPIPETPAK